MHNILGTYVTGLGTSITEHFSINLCAFPGTWTFIGMYVGYKGSMLLKISNMQDSGQDRNFEFEGNFKGGADFSGKLPTFWLKGSFIMNASQTRACSQANVYLEKSLYVYNLIMG